MKVRRRRKEKKKKTLRVMKCHLKANVLDWVSAAGEITGQQFALVQRERDLQPDIKVTE